MSFVDRFRAGYGRALEWLVAALMIVLAVEVIVGVVFRAAGRPLGWYDELASVLLAWLTFYGSALASVKRAHISCPELVDQANPKARRALNVLAQLLVMGFFGLLAWVGGSILPVLAGDTMVSLPQVPMSVVQSVIPISSVLIFIAEGLHLLDLLRGAAGHAADADAEAAGAPMPADALH